MRKRKKGSSSVQQRKLMGYAYACATGKVDNCPSSIKDIAHSFTKNDRKAGLKSLKSFAKTKHHGLPYKVTKECIKKFNEFGMINENKDVIDFLYSLKNPELNGYISDFLTCDVREKPEYIQDILLEVGDALSDEKYKWVSNELQKELK